MVANEFYRAFLAIFFCKKYIQINCLSSKWRPVSAKKGFFFFEFLLTMTLSFAMFMDVKIFRKADAGVLTELFLCPKGQI